MGWLVVDVKCWKTKSDEQLYTELERNDYKLGEASLRQTDH